MPLQRCHEFQVMYVCMFVCLSGWLAVWLAGWLAGRGVAGVAIGIWDSAIQCRTREREQRAESRKRRERRDGRERRGDRGQRTDDRGQTTEPKCQRAAPDVVRHPRRRPCHVEHVGKEHVHLGLVQVPATSPQQEQLMTIESTCAGHACRFLCVALRLCSLPRFPLSE